VSGTNRDWSSGGVDWRDAAEDDRMARDWLRNERLWHDNRGPAEKVPPGYDLALDARVSELVQTDLDPERAWNLLMALFRSASDERDVAAIALGPLDMFVRNHGDAFYARIDLLAKTDVSFLAALQKTLEGWPGRHHPRSSPN
jgi:hypothetical protein